MIDLKEVDQRSEALMDDLAQKGDVSVDVNLTSEQRLLGIPKSLVYIASLVIPKGKDPPYTKEEERIFARLQILYQQKKILYQLEEKPKLPKLFKLSPKFIPPLHSTTESEPTTHFVVDTKGKDHGGGATVVLPETKEEKTRRLKIVEELLAIEEKEAANNKNISKKPSKKNRKNKRRSTNVSDESTIMTSPSVEKESPIVMENNHNRPSTTLSLEGLATACEEIIESQTHRNSNSTLLNFSNQMNEDGNGNGNESKDVQQSNKTIGLSENFSHNNNENNNISTMEAEKYNDMSNFLNEIIASSPQNKSNDLIEGNTAYFPDKSKSYLAATSSKDHVVQKYHHHDDREDSSLRNEVDKLRHELERVKTYYEDRLKEERNGFKKKLEESLRIEREKSEERFQALQLRLYISDNRAQTLEDALDEHIAAVSHLPRRTQREGIGDSTL